MRNFLNMKCKIDYKKIFILSSIICFFILMFLVDFKLNINIPQREKFYDYDLKMHTKPEKSGTIAVNLTLTNGYELNYTRHYHGTNITIKGLVQKFKGPPPPLYVPFENVNVSIMVDGVRYPQFHNKTNNKGEFQINYTIQSSLNLYTNHTIEVNLTDSNLYLERNNPYYIISVNTTSYFNSINPAIPYLTNESLPLQGYLRYQNGTAIQGANVSYFWYYNGTSISNGTFLTNSQGIRIPETLYNELKLKLNYSSIPYVNYSETIIPKIKIFSGIACAWNIENTATEGEVLTIQGTLSSSTNGSIRIANRYLNISYDGRSIYIGQTTGDGVFTYTYTIPSGTGNKAIRVDLINDASKQIYSSRFVEIVTPEGAGSTPSPPPPPPPQPPPFQDFFLIFIPIVIGVVAGLGAYGYYRYVMLKRRSSLVQVPLEGKIKNLKILKETGRLEESLSYLFNAIYMELVGAKYGRKIKNTETIRDFAIISVKQMNLNPASIYPFITKVEEIIYGRPFKIKENDFYDACGLFSPVYFELTGYDFILKF